MADVNFTTEKFEFTDQLKKKLIAMMLIGVAGIALVLLAYQENHFSRFWSNMLANTYYFTGISLFGLFAVAAATLAYGGWHTLVKRIFISMSRFVMVSGFLLTAILALGIFGVHNLYDHVTHVLHSKEIPVNFSTKAIYFATPFWIGRLLVYASLWAFFSYTFDKFFGRTDQNDLKVYKKAKLLAAAFIVVFAVTESAVSWDMIMSLDPHWFSTLFGWYNFASYGCAAWAMTILLVIFLKSKGYLAQVNENHVHDLGKLLFGFSIFWTYLWFSQFMLQWYANIPEDTNFWVKRFDNGYYKFTVFFALVVNFVFPLLFIIKRDMKRNFKTIGFAAAVLIFGHYVDFFNYTFFEPNQNNHSEHHAAASEHALVGKDNVVLYAEHAEKTAHHATDSKVAEEVVHGGEHSAEAEAPAKNFGGIGLGEVMIFIGFLGVWLWFFFANLSKRPIVPENDPYLKENINHHVEYA
jgi:hypothetical protein